MPEIAVLCSKCHTVCPAPAFVLVFSNQSSLSKLEVESWSTRMSRVKVRFRSEEK